MMNLRVMVTGLQSDTVAAKLIPFWKHDQGSLRFWRASSNFVYVYERDGEICFLRFSSEQDHTMQQIQAELAFMNHLLHHGYPSVRPIPSENGQLAETVETENGTYIGVAFTRAAGRPLDIDSMTGNQFAHWGRSLGQLHVLSRSYDPAGERRRDWQDMLSFVRSTLQQDPAETAASAELERVESWLASLPRSAETYGLIHYDFQPDNVFWDENGQQLHVFDFDDAMYHWFAMDIAAALVDLQEEGGPQAGEKTANFLDGYRSVFPLDEDMISLLPGFLRFHKLYGFARLLRSLENSEIDEGPSWYDGLQQKLLRRVEQLRRGFLETW